MNGFLNIYKPGGMTSAAVVAVLRRLTGEKRVGHAGTLDPDAAGVLPVMIGRATRLFDFLTDKEKTYEAVIAFGARTDTQDASGRVLETGENYPDPDTVSKAALAMTGDIIQKPSIYSAIKVGGKPLYARARKGEKVEAPERVVHIESIQILDEETDHGLGIRVVCGRGTYIRTLCEDLGRLCGCPAHMRSLIRTSSGCFTLESALTLQETEELAKAGTLEERLIPLDVPISHLKRLNAPEELLSRVSAGAALPLRLLEGEVPEEAEAARLYLDQAFWGLMIRRGNEMVWRAQIPPEAEKI